MCKRELFDLSSKWHVLNNVIHLLNNSTPTHLCCCKACLLSEFCSSIWRIQCRALSSSLHLRSWWPSSSPIPISTFWFVFFICCYSLTPSSVLVSDSIISSSSSHLHKHVHLNHMNFASSHFFIVQHSAPYNILNLLSYKYDFLILAASNDRIIFY